MNELVNALKPLELTREQKNNIAKAINAVVSKNNGGGNDDNEYFGYDIMPGDTYCGFQKVSMDGTYENFEVPKEGSVYKGALDFFNDMFKLPESFGDSYDNVKLGVIKHFSSIKDKIIINGMSIDTVSPIVRDMEWGSSFVLAIDIKTAGNAFQEPMIIRLRFYDLTATLEAVAICDKDYNKQYYFESTNV